MTDFSVLDLVPVREGESLSSAFAAARDLAVAAEQAGCKRYWVAEHHTMEGIAGGATSVILSHIGNATSRIRIGSGGIMLPNHSPFQIAEQFGTLDALFPGRIDLGLGRAPGAGPELQRALRKDLHRAAEMFPHDVAELRALFAGEAEVRATPGAGANPQMWILGSSLFGAQLAARLGLPYAFASHFAPDHLDSAIAIYRRDFQPSEACAKPHVMAAMNLFAAETEEEAHTLASSQWQAFVALRTGRPRKLQPPIAGYRESLPPQAQAMLAHISQASAIGTPQQVAQTVRDFIARTGADEIVFAGPTFDPTARIRSLEMTMEALTEAGANQAQERVAAYDFEA